MTVKARPASPPLLRHVLPNGLQVRLRETPYQRMVNLGLFFRHGSQHESLTNNGIAHFIEHVMFNPRYLDPSERRRFDHLTDGGASYDAYTSKEYTRLMMTCTPEQLPEALDLLGAVARAEHVSEEAISGERPIVLQEHATAFGSLSRVYGQLLDHVLWGDQSIGLFIMGRRENIERFTADQLEARIKSHYRPERTCLVVAGPVLSQRVVQAVTAAFGAWPGSGATVPDLEVVPRPGVASFPGEKARGELVLGLPAVPFESEERPAMELLADVLGGGIKSRLFLELRERRKLVYLVQAYPVSYQGGGYIGMRINCGEEDVDAVYRAIDRILREVRRDGVHSEELERARAARLVRLFEAADNPKNYIQLAGRRCVLGEDFSVGSEVERLCAVDRTAVRKLAAEVLHLERSGAVILGFPEERLEILRGDAATGPDRRECCA